MRLRFLFVLAFPLVLSSCLMLDGSYTDKDLRGFKFRAQDNPGLLEDIPVQDQSTTSDLSFEIPNRLSLAKMVPWFRTDAFEVTIDGKSLIPGETMVDLTGPRLLSVHARDGSTRTYTVSASVAKLEVWAITDAAYSYPYGQVQGDTDGTKFLLLDSATYSGIKTFRLWFSASSAPWRVYCDDQELTMEPRPANWAVYNFNLEYTPGAHVVRIEGRDGATLLYPFSTRWPALKFTQASSDAGGASSVVLDQTQKRLTLDSVSPGLKGKKVTLSYSHTGTEVLLNGAAAGFSSTQIVLGEPNVLTLTGRDGATATWDVLTTWPPLGFSSFVLAASDNPALGADIIGVVDQSTKRIKLVLPFLGDFSKAKIKFSHNGLGAEVDGSAFLSRVTVVNLETLKSIDLKGAEGTETWTVEVTRTPASSKKELTSLNFYSGTALSPPYKPSASNLISGRDTDPTVTGLTWKAYYNGFSVKNIYVEVVTTGIKVTMGGTPLEQGLLPKFAISNWVDLSSPVAMTIEAEDGSTFSFTLAVEYP